MKPYATSPEKLTLEELNRLISFTRNLLSNPASTEALRSIRQNRLAMLETLKAKKETGTNI